MVNNPDMISTTMTRVIFTLYLLTSSTKCSSFIVADVCRRVYLMIGPNRKWKPADSHWIGEATSASFIGVGNVEKLVLEKIKSLTLTSGVG